MSYKYHQLLKYVYFEGYADSYESAECLLESLDDDEFEYLCEGVFSSTFSGAVTADANERAAETHKTAADAEHTSPKNRKHHRDTAAQHLVSARRKRRKTNEEFYGIDENVSGGRARRASSRRAPISQRVSDFEAAEIRRNARENPKPTASTPEDDSLEAMKSRFKAETDIENAKKEAKKPKRVPSRGIGPSEPVLRKGKRSTPGGTAQQRVTELGRRRRREGKKPYAPGDEERSKRISAALKNRDKWGTPEAAKEEFVIDYLVTEGYTDNYDSAISIYESMSDEWFDTILEVKGGGKVSFRGNTDDRGMPLNPSMKLYMKKTQLETGMEDEENRIRGRHNAGDGQHDDYTQSDDWRPERVSRGERGRRASAKREIENSPKMKKFQSRWDRLSDAEGKN